MAFYNNGAEKTRTFDLYLKSTEKSSFSSKTDWITVTDADKVFSGSITMAANAWTVIGFSNPFAYDGISNIVLVTDDNTGEYTFSPHMSCSVFDATNQALYAHLDNTNYNPLLPPTSSSAHNDVLSVKNQLLVTKVTPSTAPIHITVSASPTQGGVVSGGGAYYFGDTCTVTATVNEGYRFTGWTENGQEISMDLEFSFTVVQDRNLVATFEEGLLIGDGGNATDVYLPSNSYYNYSLTQQIYTADEIGSACTINTIAFYNGGTERTRNYDMYLVHTEKTVFNSNTDWIAVTEADKVFSGDVVMIANEWTVITLDTPFEYDGTSNLALVMDDNTRNWKTGMACRVFDAQGNQTLRVSSDGTNYNLNNLSEYNGTLMDVKNQILLGIEMGGEQTVELAQGWNWFSTNVAITLDDLKAALVEALPNTAITIQSQTQNTTYNPNNNRWTGRLTALNVTQMYMITVATDGEITLEGMPLNPTEHPVNITNGANWIAFPLNESMTVGDAFVGFAVTGDVIQSQTQNANYRNGRWMGQLTTLEPGQGYIYKSSVHDDRTLIFPTSAK